MLEPKIVFCKNNHIYDSAINAECPYCLNIEKEQRMLNKLVAEQGAINKKVERDEEEEATELIYRISSIENIDEDDYESTELIEYSDKPHRTYLVGWLVAIDGEQKGHSIEVVEGQNYLYQKQGTVFIKTDGFEIENKLGIIYQDISDKEFYIRPEADVIWRVNGVIISDIHILKPYDSISIQESNLVFVTLNCKYFEWGM